MDLTIIFVYCLCDDLLKSLRHWEDPQCLVSDAEILTSALVAALYFGGNFQLADTFLHDHGYWSRRLSPSRFVRRLHRCADLWRPLFHQLATLGHQLNPESLYVIDSFPLPVCDNIRIRRCRRYQGEAWRRAIALCSGWGQDAEDKVQPIVIIEGCANFALAKAIAYRTIVAQYI